MIELNIYIWLAGIFGLLMAFGMGANDVANAMGTSVGSKSLTIKQAVIIAAIFEFLGALLAGGNVTQTLSHGIADIQYFYNEPQFLIYGMLAALFASATWLFVASYYGWPVSTTHSIVGAIVGFTLLGVGPKAIHWVGILKISLGWIVSPIIGGVLSYIIFRCVQKTVLNTKNPFESAKKIIPFFIYVVSFIIAFLTITSGLSHFGFHFTTMQSIGMALIFAALIMTLAVLLLKRVHKKSKEKPFQNVERVFAILMMFTACAMAFAHGSNDVANAVGPMAAVVSAVKLQNLDAAHLTVPIWILAIGATGLVAGLITFGQRVMATVGTGITQLTPSRGFAATLAAALTVVFASSSGLPISTTHTLVGGIFGVGIARGIGALNLNVLKNIIISWVITLPAGAFMAMIYFELLKYSLGFLK